MRLKDLKGIRYMYCMLIADDKITEQNKTTLYLMMMSTILKSCRTKVGFNDRNHRPKAFWYLYLGTGLVEVPLFEVKQFNFFCR